MKTFNIWQGIGFFVAGILLFLFFNKVNFPDNEDFGDEIGPLILRVIFSIAITAIVIIFLSPKESLNGNLPTPVHTAQTRWLWFFIGSLGALVAGLVAAF